MISIKGRSLQDLGTIFLSIGVFCALYFWLLQKINIEKLKNSQINRALVAGLVALCALLLGILLICVLRNFSKSEEVSPAVPSLENQIDEPVNPLDQSKETGGPETKTDIQSHNSNESSQPNESHSPVKPPVETDKVLKRPQVDGDQTTLSSTLVTNQGASANSSIEGNQNLTGPSIQVQPPVIKESTEEKAPKSTTILRTEPPKALETTQDNNDKSDLVTPPTSKAPNTAKINEELLVYIKDLIRGLEQDFNRLGSGPKDKAFASLLSFKNKLFDEEKSGNILNLEILGRLFKNRNLEIPNSVDNENDRLTEIESDKANLLLWIAFIFEKNIQHNQSTRENLVSLTYKEFTRDDSFNFKKLLLALMNLNLLGEDNQQRLMGLIFIPGGAINHDKIEILAPFLSHYADLAQKLEDPEKSQKLKDALGNLLYAANQLTKGDSCEIFMNSKTLDNFNSLLKSSWIFLDTKLPQEAYDLLKTAVDSESFDLLAGLTFLFRPMPKPDSIHKSERFRCGFFLGNIGAKNFNFIKKADKAKLKEIGMFNSYFSLIILYLDSLELENSPSDFESLIDIEEIMKIPLAELKEVFKLRENTSSKISSFKISSTEIDYKSLDPALLLMIFSRLKSGTAFNIDDMENISRKIRGNYSSRNISWIEVIKEFSTIPNFGNTIEFINIIFKRRNEDLLSLISEGLVPILKSFCIQCNISQTDLLKLDEASIKCLYNLLKSSHESHSTPTTLERMKEEIYPIIANHIKKGEFNELAIININIKLIGDYPGFRRTFYFLDLFDLKFSNLSELPFRMIDSDPRYRGFEILKEKESISFENCAFIRGEDDENEFYSILEIIFELDKFGEKFTEVSKGLYEELALIIRNQDLGRLINLSTALSIRNSGRNKDLLKRLPDTMKVLGVKFSELADSSELLLGLLKVRIESPSLFEFYIALLKKNLGDETTFETCLEFLKMSESERISRFSDLAVDKVKNIPLMFKEFFNLDTRTMEYRLGNILKRIHPKDPFLSELAECYVQFQCAFILEFAKKSRNFGAIFEKTFHQSCSQEDKKFAKKFSEKVLQYFLKSPILDSFVGVGDNPLPQIATPNLEGRTHMLCGIKNYEMIIPWLVEFKFENVPFELFLAIFKLRTEDFFVPAKGFSGGSLVDFIFKSYLRRRCVGFKSEQIEVLMTEILDICSKESWFVFELANIFEQSLLKTPPNFELLQNLEIDPEDLIYERLNSLIELYRLRFFSPKRAQIVGQVLWLIRSEASDDLEIDENTSTHGLNTLSLPDEEIETDFLPDMVIDIASHLSQSKIYTDEKNPKKYEYNSPFLANLERPHSNNFVVLADALIERFSKQGGYEDNLANIEKAWKLASFQRDFSSALRILAETFSTKTEANDFLDNLIAKNGQNRIVVGKIQDEEVSLSTDLFEIGLKIKAALEQNQDPAAELRKLVKTRKEDNLPKSFATEIIGTNPVSEIQPNL